MTKEEIVEAINEAKLRSPAKVATFAANNGYQAWSSTNDKNKMALVTTHNLNVFAYVNKEGAIFKAVLK